MPGTVIANKADIYFDLNPPIRTNTAALTAEFNTGLSAMPDGTRLQLSPNPTGVELRLKMGDAGPGQWLIHDAQGRLVRSGRWNGSEQTIAVSGLEAGLYTITVTTAAGRSLARFVKE